MQIIERHGGGSHFVRPDRVHRTGVLTSTMGYDPGFDVQQVASSFSQYPMDLALPSQGMAGLYGLGANVGLIEKIRLRFAAWRAKRRAKTFMQGPPAMSPAAAAITAAMNNAAHNPAIGQGGMIQPHWGAAYPQIGEEIAPQMIAKEQMVAHLLRGGGLPNAYAKAQSATSWHKFTNRWWNG